MGEEKRWWQNDVSERFTQDINYPASIVNVPHGTATTALINGAIHNRLKSISPTSPATLIVNGTAMPLHVNVDGSFEIRDGATTQSQRVQFYNTASSKTQARLRVVLS